MVIDSNVVIHALIRSEWTTKARHVLALDHLRAPEIIMSEVANVLGRMVRTKTMKTIQSTELYTRVKKVPIRLVPSRDLIDRAFDLSLELIHPIFDCFYLELAIREQVPFVTTDDHFMKKLQSRTYTIDIIHLNDWKP